MTKFSEFPYFVALTGGIACGKSIVGECFKNQNFNYFDSDKASHDCYLPESNIYKKILEMYGKNIIEKNKLISKQKLAKIIFNDERERLKINSLIHPMIRKKIIDWMSLCKDKKVNGVAEIPLFFETDFNNLNWDYTICVYASEKVIFKRLKERGLDEIESISRINSQLSIKEKCNRSNYSINGENSISNINKFVSDLVIKWKDERNS